MNQESTKVTRLPTAKQSSGGGDDFDGRLRDLEIQMARMEERSEWMQRHVRENLATKNDVTGLKVWILGGVLSGILIAAGSATIIVKAFF